MKTVIVISDTHRNLSAIEKLLPKMKENDYVFHLGDHDADMFHYQKELGNKIYSVKGNCDGGGDDLVLEIENVKILLTHGDRYGVKSSKLKLLLRAKELGVNLVCYGHTHVTEIEKIDGITFVNPGCMNGFLTKTYCYLVLNNNKIVSTIVEV